MKFLTVLTSVFLAAASVVVAESHPTALLRRDFDVSLGVSTKLNTSISIWNDPQAAVSRDTSGNEAELFFVTTADGALTALNATAAGNGEVVWRRTDFGEHGGNTTLMQRRATQWNPTCGRGNLFVFQNQQLYRLDAHSGKILFQRSVAFAGAHGVEMWLAAGRVLLIGNGFINALSCMDGRLKWSAAHVAGSGWRTDPSGGPRVAFLTQNDTTFATEIVVVDSTDGKRLTTVNFGSLNPEWLYIASVDPESVLYLNFMTNAVTRYPHWTTTLPATVQQMTGYSLACPKTGRDYCNGKGYTRLYLNTLENATDGVTYHLDYKHNGTIVAVSPSHPHGHLLALADVVLMGVVVNGSNTVLYAFDPADGMKLQYTKTIPDANPYGIRASWSNMLLAPQTHGITFLVGNRPRLEVALPQAYPDGLVEHNVIVHDTFLFFTTGSRVVRYSIL